MESHAFGARSILAHSPSANPNATPHLSTLLPFHTRFDRFIMLMIVFNTVTLAMEHTSEGCVKYHPTDTSVSLVVSGLVPCYYQLVPSKTFDYRS